MSKPTIYYQNGQYYCASVKLKCKGNDGIILRYLDGNSVYVGKGKTPLYAYTDWKVNNLRNSENSTSKHKLDWLDVLGMFSFVGCLVILFLVSVV